MWVNLSASIFDELLFFDEPLCMETFVLAIGRQWPVSRLRAEVCKTFIAGFDSRRRLRRIP